MPRARKKAERKPPQRKASPAKRRGLRWADVRAICLALPGTAEGTSYGTPAFRAKGKFLTRWNDKESALVVQLPLDQREALIEARPETFFFTDHYRDWPAVLVRLETVPRGLLAELLEQSWRAIVPAKLVAELEAKRARR